MLILLNIYFPNLTQLTYVTLRYSHVEQALNLAHRRCL